MRIVGGRFRGRPLNSPRGTGTRPTTDRTRESLFNILSNVIDFKTTRTLDLFAGTGALGLEALSRGSTYCVFMEKSANAQASIRANIGAFGLEAVTQILKRDVMRAGKCAPMKRFNLVFADPPYEKGMGERAARSLIEGDWLEHDAVFVLEEASGSFPQQLKGFELDDRRQYGDTTIGLFSLSGEKATID